MTHAMPLSQFHSGRGIPLLRCRQTGAAPGEFCSLLIKTLKLDRQQKLRIKVLICNAMVAVARLIYIVR